jgi:quercetin dioxygenase-like cupin family protein
MTGQATIGQATIDALLDELCGEGDDEALLARLADLLPRTPPDGSTRARLLTTVGRGGRLHRFAPEVARLLDITEERARALLDGVDDKKSWEASPLDNVTLYHVDGGPKTEGAITGFVRIDPGCVFPLHTHAGPETVLIVQGRCRDSRTGETLRPGDIGAVAPEDGAHEVLALPGPPLVYLAVVFTGIEVGDLKFTPESYDM